MSEGLRAVGFYGDGRVLLGFLTEEGFQPSQGEAEAELILKMSVDPSSFGEELEKLVGELEAWRERAEALLFEGKPTGVEGEFKFSEPEPLSACISLYFGDELSLRDHYALYGLLSDVALKQAAHALHPAGTGFSLSISGSERENLFFRAVSLAALLREAAAKAGFAEPRFGVALADTLRLRPGLYASPAEDAALMLALYCEGGLVGLATLS